jgi:hypothetical protein
VIEANPRRCSESTAYDVGEALYGPDWEQQMAALLRLPLPIEPGHVCQLKIGLDALESANQELAQDSRVVPLSLSWLKHAYPGIGYVLFTPEGSDIESAEAIVLGHLRRAGLEPAGLVG